MKNVDGPSSETRYATAKAESHLMETSVGAAGGAAAGAAIGVAMGGRTGALIGAAVGSVAGGLTGRSLAETSSAANRLTPVLLSELHDPDTGRLDAMKVATYLKIPLKQLSGALGKNYSTVHKTPSAPTLQPALQSIKRSLEILEKVFEDRSVVLAWLNNPHPDLGRRTPMGVILAGRSRVVEDMLEGALMGIPP
jgi:hypothetical protein